MFRAILLSRDDNGTVAEVTEVDDADAPPGDVTVEVAYSSLNYKDALAITGSGPIVRSWPMVPGIDLAGSVLVSSDERFAQGDRVIVNGWGIGETRWGGLAERARLPADFLTRLPDGLTPRQAMCIGTAGYTAMLCVQALADRGVGPGAGEVVVTGANGGVGSFAVALLARRGYSVAAVTGRTEEADRLRALGAKEVVARDELSQPGKPLQKERWAGAVDSVGSHTLANVCAATRYGGVVTACGLAQGMDFTATVAPFILRGVTLVGIDSVQASQERRARAWQALAGELDERTISSIAGEVTLDQVVESARALLDGRVKGRVVVEVA